MIRARGLDSGHWISIRHSKNLLNGNFSFYNFFDHRSSGPTIPRNLLARADKMIK